MDLFLVINSLVNISSTFAFFLVLGLLLSFSIPSPMRYLGFWLRNFTSLLVLFTTLMIFFVLLPQEKSVKAKSILLSNESLQFSGFRLPRISLKVCRNASYFSMDITCRLPHDKLYMTNFSLRDDRPLELSSYRITSFNRGGVTLLLLNVRGGF